MLEENLLLDFMRNFIYLFIFLTISFTSCKPSFPEGKNFCVTLEMDSTLASYKQKIYLLHTEGSDETFLDSVITDGNKLAYTFYGNTKYQFGYSFIFEKEGPVRLCFVINPNEKLKIKLTEKDYDDYLSFTVVDVPQSKVQHEYYLYDQSNAFLRRKIRTFTNEVSDRTLSAIKKKKLQDSLDIYNKQLKELYQSLLHSDNPYLADYSTIFFQMDYGGIESYKNYLLKKFPDYPPLKTSLGITKCQPETKESKIVSRRIRDMLLRRFVRFKPRTTKSYGIGDTLKIVLHQNNGKIKYLSEYQDKYVLVDFWASWCGPCIASMPKVLEAQKRYGKDLVVCAVSLDKSNILWKKAIAKYHLSPLHHYVGIDTNGNVYKDVEELGFTAIPQSYLLDRKGKIIAINLSGEELMAKLKELCKR